MDSNPQTEASGEDAWIRTIPPREATGDVAAAYEPFFDPESGYMDNIIKVHGLHPAGLQAHWKLYAAVMEGTDSLPRVEREMVAIVVSGINACHY